MTKRKSFHDWKEHAFRSLPIISRDHEKVLGEFAEVVLLPGKAGEKHLHDSGYRCIELVPIRDGKPLGRIASWGHDVVHLDGVGGYGEYMEVGHHPMVEPKPWNIDCLPGSGLFRLFSWNRKFHFGTLLSSVDLYLGPRERNTK